MKAFHLPALLTTLFLSVHAACHPAIHPSTCVQRGSARETEERNLLLVKRVFRRPAERPFTSTTPPHALELETNKKKERTCRVRDRVSGTETKGQRPFFFFFNSPFSLISASPFRTRLSLRRPIPHGRPTQGKPSCRQDNCADEFTAMGACGGGQPRNYFANQHTKTTEKFPATRTVRGGKGKKTENKKSAE